MFIKNFPPFYGIIQLFEVVQGRQRCDVCCLEFRQFPIATAATAPSTTRRAAVKER